MDYSYYPAGVTDATFDAMFRDDGEAPVEQFEGVWTLEFLNSHGDLLEAIDVMVKGWWPRNDPIIEALSSAETGARFNRDGGLFERAVWCAMEQLPHDEKFRDWAWKKGVEALEEAGEW